MSEALSCQSITKSLGGKSVLRNLDLAVAPGEVVSLLGASGSGKTTLLRVIAGLIEPDGGTITLGGRMIWSDAMSVRAEKRRIGMVFQDYALWPHMTVEANLEFGLKAQRLPAPEIDRRVGHALEVARLTALQNRRPSELSGGQQQRVAIARCLAARPAVMLFDEPLSNLDAALREDIRAEMMDLVRQTGTTVVYVTHDQAEAMAVSDRIAVMREGSIAQLDTPQTIYEWPADAFVASFIGGFTLLPGTIRDGRLVVGNQALAVTRPGASSGEGLLVIRPEDARTASTYPETALSGTVHSRAYQGRCWRLLVDVGSHRVRLDWPEAPDVGSELQFSLPPERCVVLQS